MSHERNNVRRRLFSQEESGVAPTVEQPGAADNIHNRLLEHLLSADRKEAARRWNFDFEQEKPLEGRWEWEPVQNSSVRRDGEVTNDCTGHVFNSSFNSR